VEFEQFPDPETGVLLTLVRGPADLEGFFALFAAAAARAESDGFRKFLGDYSEIEPDSILLTVDELEQMAARFVPLAEDLAPAAIATVCVSAAQYGLTAIFKMFTEKPGLKIQHRIFFDRKEAADWLATIDLPGPGTTEGNP